MKRIHNKHFLKLLDYTPDEIRYLLELAHFLKREKATNTEEQFLEGRNIVLIFEKTSTRTRCAFEVAAHDQGANVTYLGPSSSQIGEKESMKDTAKVLGRMFDCIEYRGYDQNFVEQLAQYAGIPVINGLTTEYHPTQILADLLTIQEHCSKPLEDVKLCYIGDAHNNMANSLMVGAAKMGMDFRACAPVQYQPNKDLVAKCREIATETNAQITITDSIEKAIKDCDFVYTDVWVSMGEPSEIWDERIKALLPYQVNEKVLKLSGNKDIQFMHCLPAFHDTETKEGKKIFKKTGLTALEVTNDVFESDASLVFDQAENRMHTIKAVLVALIPH